MASCKLIVLVAATFSTEMTPVAIQATPGSFDEHDRLALNAFLQRDYIIAISHWNAAARLAAHEPTKKGLYSDTLNSLGSAQFLARRFYDAESTLCRAIDVAQMGDDIAVALKPLCNLAELYRVTGRFREAEAIYAKAWNVMRKTAIDSDAAVNFLCDVGRLYVSAGRNDDAEYCLRRALELGKRGEYDFLTIQLKVLLAQVYCKTSKYEKAKKMLIEANESQFRWLDWSELYLRCDEPKKAIETLKRGLNENALIAVNEWNKIAAAQVVWAEALMRLGQKEESKKLFDRAIQNYERAYGPTHYLVAATLERYCTLFPEGADDRKELAKTINESNRAKQPLGLKSAFKKIP